MKLDLTDTGLARDKTAYGWKTGINKVGIRTAAGISQTGVRATVGRASGIRATPVRREQQSAHGSHPRMEVVAAEEARAAICIHDQEHRAPRRHLSTNSRSLGFGDRPGAAVPSARATGSGLPAADPCSAGPSL